MIGGLACCNEASAKHTRRSARACALEAKTVSVLTRGGNVNFSIVIPTWNRSSLVESLLRSLFSERQRYTHGSTEVLVVDSSEGSERQKIEGSCLDYDAVYIEGEDSVRKKRNLGIRAAQYSIILFIDSDVTVEAGLLDAYEKAYADYFSQRIPLGGVLGYTEFVGEKTFWWKATERTSLVDSFAFSRLYPFHSWTIGNNVSFYKGVLEEIGLFEENLPFRLGSDDLDLSYRVTKAGYMIGSAPDAVTYHSRETWSSIKAIHDRAKRWGTMEWYVIKRHPELGKFVIPKDYLIEAIVTVCMAALSIAAHAFAPLIASLLWVVLNTAINYIQDMRKHGACSPVRFAATKFIQMQYEYYRVKQSLKNRSLEAFYKGMVFNAYQIKFGLADDSKRMLKLLVTYVIAAVLVLLVASSTGLQ